MITKPYICVLYMFADGDPQSLFMILNDGRVLLAKQLNRETQKQYDLTVSVTDGVNAVFTKVLLISNLFVFAFH